MRKTQKTMTEWILYRYYKDELALIQISERLAFDASKGMGNWER